MSKRNHGQTIQALRRRNQALVSKNAEMRKQMEVFVDKEKIADIAEALCVIHRCSWEDAVIKAIAFIDDKKKYLKPKEDSD